MIKFGQATAMRTVGRQAIEQEAKQEEADVLFSQANDTVARNQFRDRLVKERLIGAVV